MGTVTLIETPLVTAARELLIDTGDRSAAIAQLQRMFPGQSIGELDRTLREIAATLHCAGICPTCD